MDDVDGACGGEGVNFGELEGGFTPASASTLAQGLTFRGNVERDLGIDAEEEADYEEEELEGFQPEVREVRETVDLNKAPVPLRSLPETAQLINVTEDGGVKKLVLKKGTGRSIPEHCKVMFHYVSFVNDDAACFDSTLSRHKPHVQLMAPDQETATVITGLYHGLKSMELREVASFYIGYDYAYGKMGCPPRIPPAAQILMNVELLQVISKEKLCQVQHMTLKERSALPYGKIRDAAMAKRREGNGLYNDGQYQLAVREYRKAISMLENYNDVTNEENDERSSISATLYTNIAQSYLKMNKAPQACNACKLALNCNEESTFSKIYYRFAQAKYMLGDLEAAMGLTRKSIANNPDCAEEIRAFEKQLREEFKKKREETLSELYKKMASGLGLGKADGKPSVSEEKEK